ncbi:MAG TPA: hypothetical protein VN456_06105 [Desulfosporosinus sp.]|nr:hypothetical protein [Desulfosporosinus sp.]
MEQDKVQIDEAHAKIFARAIFNDIAAYVQSHPEEYQKYLEEEESEDNND